MTRFNTLPYSGGSTKPNTPPGWLVVSTAAPRRRCSETMAANIASHAAVVAATALTVAASSVAYAVLWATPKVVAPVAVNIGRKGATNAGKEIAKGATNAGIEVSKGIVLGAGEVAKGIVLGAGLLGAAMICSTIISRTLERRWQQAKHAGTSATAALTAADIALALAAAAAAAQPATAVPQPAAAVAQPASATHAWRRVAD